MSFRKKNEGYGGCCEGLCGICPSSLANFAPVTSNNQRRFPPFVQPFSEPVWSDSD
ncbi:uncharacterized protein LACBIDRAFT_296719 [Laccaria bicolor S238N-H82]|uniref:Predicted protein n=1 Tax=Laccaria bicolor (strain S238N-H82 / ATCC MYA-4686) TaxID=486041 RepID=B0D851_LACBS|nr:uncharacterized protein LACBIDRAFT_296715 [Laccaria bicolor S238N-H82]XP_001880330.1 uncharacterized protein LACBIDRAFT_296719 [Laccaria bicolor S238N-H82]EDR09015.1 predicted protein [Laccaria bicolor S238N-H82]EDR09017.1 predicted protein [Laccaria bicolor S238N-H82]|eukprot:XP_001880328.1 predicted protein [Laccaria bicolor S238N-H82]